MKRFNHFHIPHKWEQYWTQYPEGYTIMESLINWISQVNDMVDNQNQTVDTVEAFRTTLDDFMEQVDDDLSDIVQSTLTEWQESGFLDVVIDTALQTQMDILEQETEQKLSEFNTQVSHLSTDAVSLSKMTGLITGYIGHRGYSSIAPENTLSAFREAYMHGYNIVEMDVRRTSDGIWILMHDNTVDRTTNGTGVVANMSNDQVAHLDVDFTFNWGQAQPNTYYNEKVPTLEEVLTLCKQYGLIPQIEIQGSANVTRDVSEIYAMLQKNRLVDKVCILSAQKSILDEFRSRDPYIYLMLTKVTLGQSEIDEAVSIGNCGVTVNQGNVLNRAYIDVAHTHGVEVCCYTVNDAWRASELFNLGIDFIATDRLTKGVRK